ncbi:hypothetical protein KFO32_05590 [Pantoea ananatis]|uniref:hypothetical protein n=1 Tax=Pantoea ananas TaxID=553 RepID=UPI001FF578FD|nr:hypothetical protein [Pantoea ananatis]MCK0552549.1 hypothetical protein [Pantoea ananatis]
MTSTKIFQVVDIPDYKYAKEEAQGIDYGAVATDCETKTVSIIEAIEILSFKLLEENEKEDSQKSINNLACIINDLTGLAIATSKISNSANYWAGYQSAEKESPSKKK